MNSPKPAETTPEVGTARPAETTPEVGTARPAETIAAAAEQGPSTAPASHRVFPPNRPASTLALPPAASLAGIAGIAGIAPARRRTNRGDIRSAVLTLLAEQPLNGYQLIQRITERSNGGWKPSPGGVYPALQLLEEEGIVRTEETLGRKTYQLSEQGEVYVNDNWDALAAVWADTTPAPDERLVEIGTLCEHVLTAVRHALDAADDARIAQVRQLLLDTRRSLYQMLAAAADETG
ncbi:PadR family transcriptional regulator [Dactylosporangium sp. CA-092794]|uniref:PadR family transcriptional regulator n=1 Tax=Dactylosporangium sp. CA-092794 TaxID=3239929 RepID=UPI003D8D6E5E